MDDAQLAMAARSDPDAFARLYDRTFDQVYRFSLSLVCDHTRAEDVTAETYRRALAGIGRYEDRGRPFVAWLVTIARNVVRDGARRAGREVALLDHDGIADDWPGEGVARSERAAALQRAVGTLSPVQQRVIVLRYGHEQSCEEVAKVLGKTEAAVKQLSYRAVQRLRERMREEGYGVD